MPLPFILGALAVAAGGVGALSGIAGISLTKDANDTVKYANSRHEKNVERFEATEKGTQEAMDNLGKLELTILNSFDTFSDTIERIKNRPYFKPYEKNGVTLPTYDPEELHAVSVGAGVVLGGLSSAAAGTAGGFAAAGATTALITTFGTASTGAAIFGLHGAAATNALLATLGGGALAAGGGGMALGKIVLGGLMGGAGLLVGGIIFGVSGALLSEKAENAKKEMVKAEMKIDMICEYLNNLKDSANQFAEALKRVNYKYNECYQIIANAVHTDNRCDWYDFTNEERLATQNTILLVGLLYNMCKVKLVLKQSEVPDTKNPYKKTEEYYREEENKARDKFDFDESSVYRIKADLAGEEIEGENELNVVNDEAVNAQIAEADIVLSDIH